MSDVLCKKYNSATKQLLRQIRYTNLPEGFVPKYDMESALLQFRAAFRIPELRAQVLNPKYEPIRQINSDYSAGFCGIASFTWGQMFHMPDGSPIWQMYRSRDGMPSHVWLKSVVDNTILDLTYDQFVDPYPYHNGVFVPYGLAGERACKFGDYIGVDVYSLSLRNLLRQKD